MILYWRNPYSKPQVAGWLPHLFAAASTSASTTYQEVGVWVHLFEMRSPVYWQDNTKALFSGMWRQFISKPTGAAAVSAIIRERAMQRFVFSGISGRVN